MNKLRDFIDKLSAHVEKELLFEYAPGLFVGANYHITQVKATHIDSVDCGGQANSWDETVIQLYEGAEELSEKVCMTSCAVLKILQSVSKVRAFKLKSIVKIEYGNSNLDIKDIVIKGNQLVCKLHVIYATCKGQELCSSKNETEGVSCSSSI